MERKLTGNINNIPERKTIYEKNNYANNTCYDPSKLWTS